MLPFHASGSRLAESGFATSNWPLVVPKFSRPFVACCSSPTPSSSWLRARIMEIFSAFLLASQIWRLWRTRSWLLWGSVGQIAIILRTCALSKMGCMGRCQIDMIKLCAPRKNCNRLSRFAFKHWEIMFSLSDRNMTYVYMCVSHSVPSLKYWYVCRKWLESYGRPVDLLRTSWMRWKQAVVGNGELLG